MPTPGERKALYFLGGIALLGGIARLVGADADVRPLPAEDLAALERQLASADSAAGAQREEKRARKGRGSGAAPRTPERQSPPSSRLPPPAAPPASIDLDRADTRQMETLPGVGPALAHRIVAWRDSAGGLGGLEALDCVSGVGPALLARVAPHVTFSGSRRPSCGTPPGRPRPSGRAGGRGRP